MNQEVSRLEGACKAKDVLIAELENEKLVLEETVEALEASGSCVLEHESKTFSPEVRMLVYDSIVN